MALYVDELTHSTKDFSLSTNDYSSQIFTIELGTTQLNIKLEKVEGVVFELISRS
jgi:hypothetical protein